MAYGEYSMELGQEIGQANGEHGRGRRPHRTRGASLQGGVGKMMKWGSLLLSHEKGDGAIEQGGSLG